VRPRATAVRHAPARTVSVSVVDVSVRTASVEESVNARMEYANAAKDAHAVVRLPRPKYSADVYATGYQRIASPPPAPNIAQLMWSKFSNRLHHAL